MELEWMKNCRFCLHHQNKFKGEGNCSLRVVFSDCNLDNKITAIFEKRIIFLLLIKRCLKGLDSYYVLVEKTDSYRSGSESK